MEQQPALLADNVGAPPGRAPTDSAPLLTHSAPLPASHVRDGATVSSDPGLRPHRGRRAAPLHVAAVASPRSRLVGQLPRAIVPAGVPHALAARVSSERLPDIF